MIENQQTLWYPLRLLSMYRLLVAIALLALAPLPYTFKLLGNDAPIIYASAASSYALLALFWAITCRFWHYAFLLQLYFQFITDTALITLMMHASGGLHSGLPILLVVSIAGYSTLVRGITPYFLASIATLAILGDSLYMGLLNQAGISGYTSSGALGAAFFSIALLSNLLSRRLEESEALANQRYIALSNLEQLNELIVNQFQNGILVVDAQQRVRLINRMASQLLGVEHGHRKPLKQLSTELHRSFTRWQQHPEAPVQRIIQAGRHADIQAHYLQLASSSQDTLITLTDISALSREMQSQKLTSLGRLTASIAHEIRNPLSAINHAAQLLEESEHASDADQRLTDIITQQSQRLNGMVENIMQLSRKNKAVPEIIPLNSWLGSFRVEFCTETGLPGAHFFLNIQAPDEQIRFDASQLHQILWNLCANSMKYGQNAAGECLIHIDCLNTQDGDTCLDIYDEGAGIPADIAEHIFEPFYTTNNASSGLGLYIAHELCAFNHAELSYSKTDNSGRFRLRIPKL
ncbi:MAG: hypothetical protein CSA54_04620 [Gammaproteobacteria bacterium]|nr:MAG: hypothetical protein CSA54_04620 [Gammaproteobacteria bacterium]